jgi:hypothetical protein
MRTFTVDKTFLPSASGASRPPLIVAISSVDFPAEDTTDFLSASVFGLKPSKNLQ